MNYPAQYYAYPPAPQYYQPDGGFPTQGPPGWGHVPPQNGVPFPPQNGMYAYPGASAHPTPTPMARPKHLSRNTTSAREFRETRSRDTRNAMPLKSAMKKRPRTPSRPSTPAAPRPRSVSSVRLPSLTRQRTHSQPPPPFQPDHLLMSFHGVNELWFESLTIEDILNDIRQDVLPYWPHGIESDSFFKHRWRIVFQDKPWNCSGDDALIMRRMICRLFAALARQGFHCLTSVNTGHRSKPPRLVFHQISQKPEDWPQVDFFTVMFSRSGDKVTIADSPIAIKDSISTAIRNVFPRRISERVDQDGTCIVEIKKNGVKELFISNPTTPPVDKSRLAAYILTHFVSHGYKLNASVPLAPRGPLGFGGRKEVWIFRSTPNFGTPHFS